ncbi:hypothetical protein [Streptomyces sp. XY66]|uniref:hypothetical protein n=1 Tax=Streptomyces sp. XY66 TaxID=1415563 RepID=UPI00131C6137|nr:hypothetical protein [Streptomyces sp. XY66]
MIHIPADWLTQVFLTLRRGVTEDAHALATELQPFTEKPGQRVPVPSTTLLRAEEALHTEIEQAPCRTRLTERAEDLVRKPIPRAVTVRTRSLAAPAVRQGAASQGPGPVYARQADGADGLSQDIGHHGHSSQEPSRCPPGRPAPASGRRGAPGRAGPQ